MRVKDIVLSASMLIVLGGCSFGPSYEDFAEIMDYNAKINTPIKHKYTREIYDENRYIYRFEWPKGCHSGYLTNRDDKPEVVQEWIILSGKEYCKYTIPLF
ncbi:hypothetical protein KDD93_09220 [Campylobacter sp. faydin G-24]|uniref:Lipoprotein n=1 Tax=Campylobacter anatolicus TaxID=2829105 RepID=A0ABS5HKY4_9BACT|nr:hypothetical protein [Campylobacter anatolicus]MBR8464735.1 hypothetical protein [Campylobacter anatolicus]